MNWQDRIIGPALETFLIDLDKQLASLGASRAPAVEAELIELRRKIDNVDTNTRQQIRQHEWQARRNAGRTRQAKERENAQARSH